MKPVVDISEDAMLLVIAWGQRRLLETTDPGERAQIEAEIQDKIDLLSDRLSFKVRFTPVAPEHVAIVRADAAANARAKKAIAPKRLALLAAARAEQGDHPITGSWAEANAITDPINERFKVEHRRLFENEKGELVPVKVDAVRGALAALSKSPEK